MADGDEAKGLFPPGVYSIANLENARGKFVFVIFKRSEPLEGYLWNIDPTSGSVLLYQTKDEEEGRKARMVLCMNDAIAKIHFDHQRDAISIREIDESLSWTEKE